MSENNTTKAIDANAELKKNIINNLKNKSANKKTPQNNTNTSVNNTINTANNNPKQQHQRNNKPSNTRTNKPRQPGNAIVTKNNNREPFANKDENKIERKTDRRNTAVKPNRYDRNDRGVRNEKTISKNKSDRLDKTVPNKYNKFNRSNSIRAESVVQVPKIVEEEIIPIDYAAFLKNEREKTNEGEATFEIIGVRFKPVGKIYFFSPENESFNPSDKVITQTTRGIEMGEVVFGNRFVSENKVFLPLKPIIRRATEDDIKRVERNQKAAKEAIKIAEECVKPHNLKMKFVDAEYMFDNSKLTYYFTHEGRVDFRDLLPDLAAIFKIRIELRQIATRDQTKIIGGLSVCGRPFCCSSFLPEFESVTIKMVKDQNISINSAKISGACGKLMCCLKYEHDTYEELNKDLPRNGAFVETDDGDKGVVIECNAITGMCRVKITRTSNQRSEGENIIRSYSKKQLKITGHYKKDQDTPDIIAESVQSMPNDENLIGTNVDSDAILETEAVVVS